MTKSLKLVAGVAALLIGLSASAQAGQNMATGDQITAAVSDKTIHGSMVDGKPYAQFYMADGTIKADGYTGKWSIKDDSMCYQFGDEKPVDCWEVDIHGPIMTWYKDGRIEGAGVAIEGNVNEF